MKNKFKKFTVIAVIFAFCGCGGGGGNDSGSETPPVEAGAGAGTWLAQASVVSDTCGERIAPVTQVFKIQQNGSTAIVDSSIVSLQAVVEGGDITTEFQETNGNCTRHYTASFSGFSGGTAQAHFTALSNCNGQSCKSEWAGTATQSN